MTNLVLATDSYKLTHHAQYPPGTEVVYSYLESRAGAEHPYTVFFGLQSILRRYLAGVVVTQADIEEASALSAWHFGNPSVFNRVGWEHVVREHGGRLPLRIKAVPEGTVVPTGNVLMTVENTDPACFWLTNAVESLLTHVWYPTTVATLSHHTLAMIGRWLDRSADSRDGRAFMLHDFGYRGASSHESAAIGGAGHLVNGLGTDTLAAMQLVVQHYGASLDTLAFSVPATEHSVMTAEGPGGERGAIERALAAYPTGIVSIVGDSYDIYAFVDLLCTDLRDRVMERDGKVVVRPDSPTERHPETGDQLVWILDRLLLAFGGRVNDKGYRVLDPHVGVLWGDGIGPAGINTALATVVGAGYSAENVVFGMGGGLLQKVDRDTERFAFKCSAMRDATGWREVFKAPLDATKASKRGRLSLVNAGGGLRTIPLTNDGDLLRTVFENGQITRLDTFDEIRARAREGAGS